MMGSNSLIDSLKRSFQRSQTSRTTGDPEHPPPALLKEEDLYDSDSNAQNGSNDNQSSHHDADEHDEGNADHLQEVSQNENGDHQSQNESRITLSHIEDNENDDKGDNDNNEDNEYDSNHDFPDDELIDKIPQSGFSTRLLADDDLGEDDDENEEEDLEERENGERNVSDDDDDAIDRAFFGLHVGDSDEEEDEYFNEWYLLEDEESFLAPILFEDGMNSDECNQYYITLEEDKLNSPSPSPYNTLTRWSLPAQFRSALPLRPLEEEEADELPSCLRESKTRAIQQEMVPIRRRSFGGLPTLQEMPEFYRAHSCPDLSTLQSPHHRPKVNFDTEVQVVTVYAAIDYPRKIRSSLWFTRREIRASRKEASYERRRERRQREKDYAAGRGTF